MKNLERFLHNIETRQVIEETYALNEEKIRDVASRAMQDRVDSLKDDHEESLHEIEKDLKSITFSKHVIQKRQDSICSKNTGLPVSNIYHDTMISFTKETMILLNKFGISDSIKPSQLDNNLMQIVEAIKVYNENLAKSVRKGKITIDDGESALKNIHILIHNYHEITKNCENGPLGLSVVESEKSI